MHPTPFFSPVPGAAPSPPPLCFPAASGFIGWKYSSRPTERRPSQPGLDSISSWAHPGLCVPLIGNYGKKNPRTGSSYVPCFLLQWSTFALDRNTHLASAPGALVRKCVCMWVCGCHHGVLGVGRGTVEIVRESLMLKGSFSFPPLTSPSSSPGLCVLHIVKGNTCLEQHGT